jgi:hypothetical protein
LFKTPASKSRDEPHRPNSPENAVKAKFDFVEGEFYEVRCISLVSASK